MGVAQDIVNFLSIGCVENSDQICEPGWYTAFVEATATGQCRNTFHTICTFVLGAVHHSA